MFNAIQNDIKNDLAAQELTDADILQISGGAKPEDVAKCMDPKSSDAQIYACLKAL